MFLLVLPLVHVLAVHPRFNRPPVPDVNCDSVLADRETKSPYRFDWCRIKDESMWNKFTRNTLECKSEGGKILEFKCKRPWRKRSTNERPLVYMGRDSEDMFMLFYCPLMEGEMVVPGMSQTKVTVCAMIPVLSASKSVNFRHVYGTPPDCTVTSKVDRAVRRENDDQRLVLVKNRVSSDITILAEDVGCDDHWEVYRQEGFVPVWRCKKKGKFLPVCIHDVLLLSMYPPGWRPPPRRSPGMSYYY